MIGVCGTPGTGKKTVSPVVAKLMGLPAPISINSLAPKGESEVDTALMRRRLLALDPPRTVLFGHLLPHVLKKPEAALVAVLRCEPAVLRERLVRRGYPRAKVTANVEAELIGVVLDECVGRFGSRLVREYDTTSSSPKAVAGKIAMDAEAARVPTRGRPAWIDWTLRYDSSTKLRSLLGGESEPPAST
ncbi:MAG: AAA family ATPase [Thaumarchaeota archaeon]|nr:AAA family ATPase [Nitrososphaerota archaeon]